MKKYENMDNWHEREHIVEITLQLGEAKGTMQFKMGGNCFGYSILTAFDPDYLPEEDLCKNDIDYKLLEGEDEDWFTCTLKNDKGEKDFVEMPIRELNNMIVKLEIVDCVIEKRK